MNKQDIITIIFLIIFFPVGLYMMWKKTDWKKNIKIAISVIWGILVIIIITGGNIEDVTPPELHTQENITFQLGDNINKDEIIQKSLISVEDDFDDDKAITLYLKNYNTISNEKTSKNLIKICAKDSTSNETCNDVNIIVSDSDQKAAEEAKAKAEAEAKAKAEEEAKEKAAEEAKAKAEAEEEAKEQAAEAAESASTQSKAQQSIPVGATALCQDNTYSYSASHRGTCSHHGGVAQWYN